jgi:hypothetical protein
MLHRRCYDDDGRGLAEPLDDQSIIQSELFLLFDTPVNSAELHRRQSLNQQFPLTVITIENSKTQPFIPLTQPLPYNVHILSLQALDPNTEDVILRVQVLFSNIQC